MDYFLFGVLIAAIMYLNYLIYMLKVQVKDLKKLTNDLLITLGRLSRNS